ncbi:MAG: DMT family transporter [Alphaproteobacteria bacterium]|nr:DMT family transporter [Alphaproteobacteria bacterium]
MVVRFGRAEMALVGITMIWGTTFLLVHWAMTVSGPYFFVGLRFGTAALVMLPFVWSALRGITMTEIKAGLIVGLTIAVGYMLQTMGLQTIPSSKSAFITALYVPLVPLLQWLVLRRPPGLMAWAGAGLAFVGMVALAGPDGMAGGMGRGEWLTIISTLVIAAEIIAIGYFAPKVDAPRVTIIQLATASLLSFAAMGPAREYVPGFSWMLASIGIGLGLASALIQVVMNWAQRSVSPTRATVIYAGEPVFAGILGRLAGERLPSGAFVGAALIIVGIIVSELKPRSRRSRITEE